MDVKAPSGQETRLLMLPKVPASARPLLALLSPYQHMHPSFNDYQCTADLGSRHDVASPTLQMPALTLCPFQHPTHGPLWEDHFWVTGAGFPSLAESQNARKFSFSLLESPTTDRHLQDVILRNVQLARLGPGSSMSTPESP